ncbi:hypothetical protein FXN63_15225 [Pigmentiphaga aceris]|uniref:Uncharacterized protein n=1 Tax=Pigmentiphaga aceris TaxID=1940612 RepID=A0A5C0AXG0_9BURK|nr:hypothetical protein [Pigmentiphaga aceris]QEI07038.1 hypothetical protein FXN63_15225 [Pigmentiphaga aceris]
MVTLSTVGAGISIGLQTLAAAALNKFDTLNSIANFVSGGSINRDKLAERILHKVVDLGVAEGISAKALGERSAELIPMVRDAAIANDMGRMKAAVADLASEGLSKVMDKNTGGLGGIVKGHIDATVRSAASSFAEGVVGDHAAEKVVATMVKEHGWEPLDKKMKEAIGTGFMRDFACRQIKNIIQRAIVDKPEYDQRADPQYKAVAGLAHQFLTGEKNYGKPLTEYATTMASRAASSAIDSVVSTATAVASSVVSTATAVVESAVSSAALAVDGLQETLGSEPQPIDGRSAFSDAVIDTPPPVVTETTTPRDLAQALVLESIREQRAPDAAGGDAPPTVAERLETATLTPEKRAELEAVADQVSPEQLAPLGARSHIEVAQTWSGSLASVQAHSYLITDTSEQSAQATIAGLERAPTGTTDRGGYRVATAFGSQVKDLALELPASSVTYGGAAFEGGRALMNTGWAMLGYSTGPDHAELSILNQVYNCCGKDAAVMGEATRYLDPAVARDALVMPTMRSLGAGGGEVLLGDTRVQLERGEPEISFQMASQEGTGFVAVTITAQWNVTGFGKVGDAELRTPVGDAGSSMSAAATVHIHPGVDGGPPRTEFFPLGVVTDISNTMTFDRATGGTV